MSFGISGCGENDDEPLPVESLSQYIVDSDLPVIRQQLIACALGGQMHFLPEPANSVSIIYYPEGNANSVKYFETGGSDIDIEDFSLYQEMILDDRSLFGGYLRRFIRSANTEVNWCVVTYIKEGNLHISDPILLRLPEVPTEFNSELLEIDQSINLSPEFSWEDGIVEENIIYFHVVTDNNDNLISGTYTTEKQFRFYDLGNVVLNIRDIDPPPTLMSNTGYTFTLMGISDDNWVNLVIEEDFETP